MAVGQRMEPFSEGTRQILAKISPVLSNDPAITHLDIFPKPTRECLTTLGNEVHEETLQAGERPSKLWYVHSVKISNKKKQPQKRYGGDPFTCPAN
jgi:hypothetical protein